MNQYDMLVNETVVHVQVDTNMPVTRISTNTLQIGKKTKITISPPKEESEDRGSRIPSVPTTEDWSNLPYKIVIEHAQEISTMFECSYKCRFLRSLVEDGFKAYKKTMSIHTIKDMHEQGNECSATSFVTHHFMNSNGSKVAITITNQGYGNYTVTVSLVS